MYKTSAVYNAFVSHKQTLGTKLEVCSGSQEVIVPLHRGSAERSTSLPDVQNIWMLLGVSCLQNHRHGNVRHNGETEYSVNLVYVWVIIVIGPEGLHTW